MPQQKIYILQYYNSYFHALCNLVKDKQHLPTYFLRTRKVDTQHSESRCVDNSHLAVKPKNSQSHKREKLLTQGVNDRLSYILFKMKGRIFTEHSQYNSSIRNTNSSMEQNCWSQGFGLKIRLNLHFSLFILRSFPPSWII